MEKQVYTSLSYIVECIDVVESDRLLITDMFDTFRAWKNTCNYMSANMLGVNKRLFIINYRTIDFLFINPQIVYGEDEFEFEQTCVCYKAKRTAKRYKKIDVEFFDSSFEPRQMHLENEFAIDFQHMMDHINGKQI